ncbi:initiation-specific alpha-1,6-mannosyltransferase [Truncatella angustata]|uniref:Initiation-specific alpha-1,6-mannosyltransferase n=1 Tax=Truncatella angustata TaxID=152316 RepID=A0A9P8UD24_9PEZI|nr:initiation-specific alpha-1,6-mannosyltransferase [Truncatella angustata]KAH6646642.1 initiation-specific alpha-1,6-mannosyltransferase [Truncatella angustata]KAH8204188.1 hypothetical protein TruAng_001608 [Truncatella angustata]
MHLPLRHSIVSKLLGGAGILAVCYYVLQLQTRDPSAPAPVAMTPPLQTTPTAKPEPTPDTIPKKLWYKLGPNGLSEQLRRYSDSCITMNPTFRHEFMTDSSGDDFVKDKFGASRPDIVDSFLAISVPIIKADLLRYLVLYEYGGVWNDLDVSCEVPITEWIPNRYNGNASVVVGLEFDVDIWVRQFASWTIMAKQKSPHLLTVVEDCLEYLAQKAKEYNVGIHDLKLNMIDDIVDVSGPRRLTRGVLKSLSKKLNEEIGNNEISHVSEPRLIGDLLVLPDFAFANSMNQQYGDKKSGQVLITHHYAGSWKNTNGGEEHVDR